ncbi:MAG: cytochrome c maturation protein CcmE [Bacillati bacterium ANGP1]|uniref:Cytochrome c maturation protein CcmE n=1 Tax=Candidatus Segetimicrobium genomatis TaxID=2569760 RepID=A0A537IX56_9BACT|nr:MAG: cytochrome c maturation protein CcmE [Terrabacteria group bacterium ANGP1]
MKRTRLILAAVIVAGALVYLILGGLRGAIVYYATPSEVLAQGQSAVGRATRLGGQVVPGSRRRDPITLELRFVLTDGKATVPVVYRGAPPELFTEGQGAIVEGTLRADGVFAARSIIVKHSEEYAPPKTP